MKQLLLLPVILLLSCSVLAQSPVITHSAKPLSSHPRVAAKTTAIQHDSLYMSNLGLGDTVAYTYSLPNDSGIISGTNALNFYGFAERYAFSAADSLVKIIGVAAVFVGTVSPTSPDSLLIKVWESGTRTASSRPTLHFSGFPTTTMYAEREAYTNLGITATSVTFKDYYFTTPTGYLTDTFFVGYTLNYTWSAMGGDTIGVGTTLDGSRTSPVFTIAGTDTTVNVQNAVLTPTNVWVDNGYSLGFKINYWLFPIVNTIVFLSTPGIVRKDFTFYGNYPNPAVNSTNFKFALANRTDVIIQVMNTYGQAVKTIDKMDLGAGEHIVNLETDGLAAGNYVCVIRTADGDGIASQISVIK